jgi:hypothetical protein
VDAAFEVEPCERVLGAVRSMADPVGDPLAALSAWPRGATFAEIALDPSLADAASTKRPGRAAGAALRRHTAAA